MKVLITGAGGMLSTDLACVLGDRGEGYTHSHLDILDRDAVRGALERHQPDWLVNCAAYTDVNGCESNPAAFEINAEGPGLLAAECREAGAKMAQLSTDYVFDGASDRPYREDDPPAPLNEYGRGKLEGERAARAAYPEGVWIVRTAWLFGAVGRSFPKSILHAAALPRDPAEREIGEEGRPLRVVGDQTGSPTYTRDLAEALLALLQAAPQPGVYHVTNSGEATWHDVAVETLRLAGLDAPVERIATEDRPTPAIRPRYSVLDCSKAAALGVGPLRPWRAALADFVRELQDLAQVS